MPFSTSSHFPETPTIQAQLVRTEWGAYKATLTLPDGHDETLAGDDLDAAREQVIDAARGYLRTQLGRPGRLRVQDPDGTWLLGVPLDGSDLVPLTATPLSEPVTATTGAPAPQPAAAPRREPPALPARPTITPRRPATPRKRRTSRSLGRRVTAAGALLLGLVVLVSIADAVQGSSPPRVAHHAAATARPIPTVALRTPTVTGPATTSITTPAAHRAPRARPRPRPRHNPLHHHAARARHVTHHVTPASISSSPTPAPSSTSSTPSTSSSTPTSTYTPPVSSYTPPASTGGYSNSLPAPGDGPPPL